MTVYDMTGFDSMLCNDVYTISVFVFYTHLHVQMRIYFLHTHLEDRAHSPTYCGGVPIYCWPAAGLRAKGLLACWHM